MFEFFLVEQIILKNSDLNPYRYLLLVPRTEPLLVARVVLLTVVHCLLVGG